VQEKQRLKSLKARVTGSSESPYQLSA
jgi:hypothetical protein